MPPAESSDPPPEPPLDRSSETRPDPATSWRQVELSTVAPPRSARPTDYRVAAAERPMLRVTRAAYVPEPRDVEKEKMASRARAGALLLMATMWTFAAVSVGSALDLGDSTGYAFFGLLALFFGVVGAVPLFALTEQPDVPRLRGERLDQVVRVDVDDSGVRGTPRDDEAWGGSVDRDEIESVYAQPWHRGGVRVRVALRSGHHYTLVDGLRSEVEAEEVASAITDRLKGAAPK